MPNTFLLTKPHMHPRADLCFKLLGRTEDARLYLCEDGIYCLLDGLEALLPAERIFPSKEDVQARGVHAGDKVVLPDDFYGKMVEDIMACSGYVYAF
jgi:tRNA 2-thiouridine synthesizing protein B